MRQSLAAGKSLAVGKLDRDRWIALQLPAMLAFVMILTAVSGCQSLNPFRAGHQPSMTQRLSQQWTNVGLDALGTGKLAQAKSFFSRATAENPQDPSAQINLARTLRQEGDLTGAREHMQRGVELSGNRDPKLLAELGEIQLQAGQWLEAQQQAELALKIDHRCAAAWALQGRVYQGRGDWDSALTNFQRAASLDSATPDIQLSIAQVYQSSNQPLRALAAIEKLLQRYPLDQQPEVVLLAKGEVLIELQQLNAAIDILQNASERSSPSNELLLRLAEAQINAGQFSQARQTINRGRDLAPQDAEFIALMQRLPVQADRYAAW